MQITRTVETTANQEAVFAYLSDFTTTTEWDPGTVLTERQSGDGGVGTRYHNTSKFMGRETQLTYEVLEYDEPNLVRLRGDNSTVTATDTIKVVPTGTGTRVTYNADFAFKGLLGKVAPVLSPLLALAFKRLGDEAERGLRDALARL